MMRFLICAALLTTIGCGGVDERFGDLYSVSGHVTFQGQPVGEGEISFLDASNSANGAATIEEDGTYSVDLPRGAYAVVVSPPLVTVDGGEFTDSYEEPKDMKNIPEIYHSAASTPLTVDISADKSGVDFDMQPVGT